MAVSRDTIAGIRFGLGLRPGWTPSGDPDALMAQVRNVVAARPLVDDDLMSDRRALALKARQLKGCARKNSEDQDCRAAFQEAMGTLKQDVTQDHFRWMRRLVLSENGAGERLALFWSSHFAVDFASVAFRSAALHYEDTVIRRHMTGRFADMLKALVRHPAMLNYLSQARSIGPNSRTGRRRGRGVNEDFARELMELHTIGLTAGYTQTDVRELALLLTGLSITPDLGFAFRAKWAEPGARRVLGVDYDGAGMTRVDRVLEDLARHPGTARRIAVKLARHYTADTPDPDLVSALEGAYRRSDGRLDAVYRTLFEHPAPWRSFGEKVKAPIDYIISATRAVGVDEGAMTRQTAFRMRPLLTAMRGMGQPLFRPRSPEGWPDVAGAWISPAQITARTRFAEIIARFTAKRGAKRVAREALADAIRPLTERHMAELKRPADKLTLLFASPEFHRR